MLWPKSLKQSTRDLIAHHARRISATQTTKGAYKDQDMSRDAKRIGRLAKNLLQALRKFEKDYPFQATEGTAIEKARDTLATFQPDDHEGALIEAGFSSHGTQWPLIAIQAHMLALNQQFGGQGGRRKNFLHRLLVEEVADALERDGITLESHPDREFHLACAAAFEIAGFTGRDGEPLDPGNYISDHLGDVKS